MIKTIVFNIGIGILNIIYSIFKLRKTKNQITLVSRESNMESIDFTVLRSALETSGKYNVVVLTKKLDKSPIGVIKYLAHMFAQMWNFAESKVVVTDTYCIAISVLKHKKDLKVIQIWHAISAIKKFGYQTIGKKDGASEEIAKLMRMHKNYDYVISPSETTDRHFSKAFGVDKNKIVRLGLPRIDYIRNIVPSRSEAVYEEYPKLREIGKKVVLYVPTMRKNRGIDLERFIEAFDESKYEIVIKFHPLDDSTKIIKRENVIYDNRFSSYDFLSVADIVISDYSSFSVEAALLDIPLYFYLYDYDEYMAKTGVNIDFMKESISCYIAKNEVELIDEIETVYDFDKLHEFRDKYVSDELDECTKQMVSFIERISDLNDLIRSDRD